MDRLVRELENRYEEYYEKFGSFPQDQMNYMFDERK